MSLLDDMAEALRGYASLSGIPSEALQRYDEQSQARKGWVEDEVWVAVCPHAKGAGTTKAKAAGDLRFRCLSRCDPEVHRVRFLRPPVTPREPVECEGEVSGE